jgi:hypothetical protein
LGAGHEESVGKVVRKETMETGGFLVSGALQGQWDLKGLKDLEVERGLSGPEAKKVQVGGAERKDSLDLTELLVPRGPEGTLE